MVHGNERVKVPQPEPPKSCDRVVPLAALMVLVVVVVGRGEPGLGVGRLNQVVCPCVVLHVYVQRHCTASVYCYPLTPLYCKALRAFQGWCWEQTDLYDYCAAQGRRYRPKPRGLSNGNHGGTDHWTMARLMQYPLAHQR